MGAGGADGMSLSCLQGSFLTNPEERTLRGTMVRLLVRLTIVDSSKLASLQIPVVL